MKVNMLFGILSALECRLFTFDDFWQASNDGREGSIVKHLRWVRGNEVDLLTFAVLSEMTPIE